ncbi:MAG: hypothetical protein LBK91_01605 [Synergistaceae bacterium]|jgi:hypothetical protein|nr:hypothetical protein [Synergistaceae bacterium]
MSIIKDALEYLVGLKQAKTFNIDGRTYADGGLTLVEEAAPSPRRIEISSLGSLVKLVRSENKHFVVPTFIRIENEREITVFSTYCITDKYNRYVYYDVGCSAPSFAPGWFEREDAMIKLMSVFVPNEGSEYILNLIGRMTQNSSIETDDNGITQKVTIKSGVEIKASTVIKPIVTLKPYRTFLEVEQPESAFLLRIGERAKIGLMEADGCKWVLDAKKNIAEFLENNLSELVESGEIVILP